MQYYEIYNSSVQAARAALSVYSASDVFGISLKRDTIHYILSKIGSRFSYV